MYSEMNTPDSLPPDVLDAYLARGWYRMGQSVFTSRFVTFYGVLYPTIWVRLPLEDFVFSKSLRRRMRRNGSRFTVEVGAAAEITAEKEALYQRYRADFSGELSPSLEAALFDGDGRSIFDTRQVEIRDGDRLVAFSFFDQGAEGIASIIGVYEPTEKQHSLGLHTMLLEVEHAQRTGLRFFYPGYVVPGYQPFDYKRRLGEAWLEFYDTDVSGWRPYATLRPEQLATHRLQQGLQRVCTLLHARGIAAEIRIYPMYRYASVDDRLLKQPLFVECRAQQTSSSCWVISYDYEAETYNLDICVRVADLQGHFADGIPAAQLSKTCLHLLQQVFRLAEAGTAEQVVDTLIQVGVA
jgi:arginine-tRNA-protein transferase